jgi:hypothetical protein
MILGNLLMYRRHAGIFRCSGFLGPLRMKALVDSGSRSWKDFICREEKRKAAWDLLQLSFN